MCTLFRVYHSLILLLVVSLCISSGTGFETYIRYERKMVFYQYMMTGNIDWL